jgi:putative drug exporter of the RND superfamily
MQSFSVRHPRVVLVLWVVAVAALTVVGLGAERRLHRTNVTIDGTPSARAATLAKRYFGDSQTLVVMLTGPPGELEREAAGLAAQIERRPRTAVLGPWAPGAAATLRPRAGCTLILIRSEEDFEHVSRYVVPVLRDQLRRYVHPPFVAHLSGYPDIANGLNAASIDSLKRSELIAGPLLLLVLLAVFRSPIAAAVPLVLGVMSIGAATGVLDLVNRVTPIDAVGLNMASMFGLALAVDYSLLIVSRFREEVRDGANERDAARHAARTAGRTVVFAGLALGASMIAAALIAPGTLLLSGGIGTITAVAIGMVGATTSLPALLVVAGRHLDRGRIGRPRTRPGRWAHLVGWGIRRPLLAAALITGLLMALSAPALAVKVGVPDPHALPASRPERKDFDAIVRVLPGGWMAPYDVVVASRRGPITSRRDLEALDRWQRSLAASPRVRAVLGPAPIYGRLRAATRTVRGLRQRLGAGQRGMQRLSDGLDRIHRGVQQLQSGLAQAAGGAARIAGGGSRAASGAAELHQGLLRARAGSVLLDAGLATAGAGASTLESGSARAADGAARLARGVAAAESRTSAGTPQIRMLAERLRAGARGLRRLESPVQISQQALNAARGALERMLPTSKADPSYRTAYEEVLRASSALSGRDARTGAPVSPGYRGLAAELSAASDSTAQAGGAVARLADASDQLAGQLGRLAAGGRQLAAGLGRLTAGSDRVRASLARLGSGGRGLTTGLAGLVAGGGRLATGVSPLGAGAERLASGLRGGSARSTALASGLERIQTGVKAQSHAVAGLPGAAQTRIFDSPYLTLAGLDTARPADRTASTFAVNLDRGGSATRLVVIDGGDPTAAGDPLRKRLDQDARRIARRTGLQVAVGGPAAQLQDFAHAAGANLWLLMLVLAAVSYAVLVPVLRSLVLPLLAVGLNVLTVGAAFGVLTLLFVGAAPLGGSGHLDAIMARAILSIVFALSIDYAVFLLTRIREGYTATGSTERALEYGLGHTASVITGAALIMVGVFVAFAMSPVTSMRTLGVGLTIAVLLDATLVRLVLLPSAIRLLGRVAWWLPGWLDRVLPKVDLEGGSRDRAAAEAEWTLSPPAYAPTARR